MSDTSSPIQKKGKKVKHEPKDDDDGELVEYASEEDEEKPDKKTKHAKIKEKEKEKKKAKDKAQGFGSDEVEVEHLKDEIRFHLDPRKKLCVSKYKGNLQVNIREFYEKDGELLPTKKAWNNLKKSIDKIDEALKKV